MALKYRFNIGSFCGSIRPGLRCLRAFGLVPFTLVWGAGPPSSTCGQSPSQGPETALVKFIDIVIFVAWQLFFLQMMYTRWPPSLLLGPMSQIMNMFSIFLLWLLGIGCSQAALLLLVSRKKFVKLLQLVERIDGELLMLGCEIEYGKLHLMSVVLHSTDIAVLLGLTAMDLYITYFLAEHVTVLVELQVYYYTIRIVQLSAVCFFISGLINFRTRLRALSKRFRKLFLQPTVGCAEGNLLTLVRTMATVHDQLVEAIQLFSELFFVLPLITCASVLVYTIFTVVTIGSFLTNFSALLGVLSGVYGLPTAVYASHIILVIKLGSDVKNESNRMVALVHKAINQSSMQSTAIERLLLFSHQLKHRAPTVSCGLFSFDWTLGFSIISALATYVVIMVQFELAVPQFFINAILQQGSLWSGSNFSTIRDTPLATNGTRGATATEGN